MMGEPQTGDRDARVAPATLPGGQRAAEAVPLLNWAQALEHLDGNEALLHNMADVFCRECPKLMIAIRAAITQGDTAELRRAAHTLKGSADIFAAGATVEIAGRLETMGRDANLTDVDDIRAELEDALEQLLPALRHAAKLEGCEPS